MSALFAPGDVVYDKRSGQRVLVVKESREQKGGRRGFEGFAVRRTFPEGFRIVAHVGSTPRRVWGYRRDVARIEEEDASITNLDSFNLYPLEKDALL